jgi:hypothetical protein
MASLCATVGSLQMVWSVTARKASMVKRASLPGSRQHSISNKASTAGQQHQHTCMGGGDATTQASSKPNMP